MMLYDIIYKGCVPVRLAAAPRRPDAVRPGRPVRPVRPGRPVRVYSVS